MPYAPTMLCFVLSTALVIALSLGVCVAHRRRNGTRASDYLHGALTWIVSVALKVVLAVAIFTLLRRLLGGEVPLWLVVPVTGLLTGVTECTLTFLIGRTPRWRTASWSASVGFGLGFGCFEAFVLAVPLLLAALAGWLGVPLTADESAQLMATFDDPWRPLTFFHERAIAVPVHLLASVLLLRAAQTGRHSLFWAGFLVKSLIDAVPAGEALSEPVRQAIYAAFGVASLLGFLHFARAHVRASDPPA